MNKEKQEVAIEILKATVESLERVVKTLESLIQKVKQEQEQKAYYESIKNLCLSSTINAFKPGSKERTSEDVDFCLLEQQKEYPIFLGLTFLVQERLPEIKKVKEKTELKFQVTDILDILNWQSTRYNYAKVVRFLKILEKTSFSCQKKDKKNYKILFSSFIFLPQRKNNSKGKPERVVKLDLVMKTFVLVNSGMSLKKII